MADILIDIYKQETWQIQKISIQPRGKFVADERVIDSILKIHQMDKNKFYERLNWLNSNPKNWEKYTN